MSMEPAIKKHLQDEDIVRLLDEEVSEGDQVAGRDHLLRCESCRRLADEIAATSRWLGANVSALDPTPPDELTRARTLEGVRAHRDAAAREKPEIEPKVASVGGTAAYPRSRGSRYWLAAAGIAVLVVASLTVEPVRAWIQDGLLNLGARPESIVEVESPELPTPVPSAASVRFTAEGPIFQIEVAATQVEGDLTVRIITEGEASAEIVGGSGETLVVLPFGLRVGNRESSTASYVVELPSDVVRGIEVRVGERMIASRPLDGVTGEIELILAPKVPAP